MANELTATNTGKLITALDTQGLGEMLKPLIREIFLFDTCVAGTGRLEDPSVLGEIETGCTLNLQREPDPFDENAIVLKTGSGKKVGYIPEKDNIVFARLMDAGKMLTAKVCRIKPQYGFTRITISIYLVDF